jgi:hypothetical protein
MGKIKKVAGTDEPIVGVEVVAEPVVVQIPTLAIPVQVPHVAVAVRVLPDKLCKCHPRHCLLNEKILKLYQ